jgi:predicted peptidase
MRVIPALLTICLSAHTAFAQARGAAPPPAPLAPNPTAPLYQATGEQYRIYNFPGTGESIPYRLFVPSRWSTATKLPMLVTLRAGNTVDGPYRADNNLVRVASQHGYIVVTPMGYRGLSQPYYGSRYQIARPGAAAPAAGWTEQEDQRAEQDVINVMDLVAKEYNVDLSRVYLHGQNPSGSGALYLAQKYPERFAAVVVSSAPIVYEAYPFDRLKGRLSLLVIHGDQDNVNPMAASQKMAEAAKAAGVETTYATVPGGTHLEAYLTYASQIFDFLDAHKK